MKNIGVEEKSKMNEIKCDCAEISNYERIKNMSLEDMARHISHICREAKKTQPKELMCLDSNNCYLCLKHYLERKEIEDENGNGNH